LQQKKNYANRLFFTSVTVVVIVVVDVVSVLSMLSLIVVVVSTGINFAFALLTLSFKKQNFHKL
jgi:hypothetical protein